MKQQDLTKLINLFLTLRKRKLPLVAIIAIVAATALFGGKGLIPGLPGDSGPEGSCQVTKVYDGDTMTLDCAGEVTKVRMYCIDTPEIQQKPWGHQARDHLRGIAGTHVTLKRIDKDRYGRIVGEVYTSDGTNLNLAQVEAGQAAVYSQYCKKKAEYEPAQARARAAKRGIWSESGMQQTPWDWRKVKK